MKKYHHYKPDSKEKKGINWRFIVLDVVILFAIVIALSGTGLVPGIQQNLSILLIGATLLIVCIVALANPQALRMPKIPGTK